MGLPAPKIIEEVQTENGGTIKIKISMMGKNRQMKAWWSDTDKMNPLGMMEPGGNRPFVWRGAGVWARFWEACMNSTRPFTRTAEQLAADERRSKQPKKGSTYEVEKILAFNPDIDGDSAFLVKWFGYDQPGDNTHEPASSFAAGLDTYTWASKEAWEHFCAEGPSAFGPVYASSPAPTNKKKSAGSSGNEAPAAPAEPVAQHSRKKPESGAQSSRRKAEAKPAVASAAAPGAPAAAQPGRISIPSSAKPPLSSLMAAAGGKGKGGGPRAGDAGKDAGTRARAGAAAAGVVVAPLPGSRAGGVAGSGLGARRGGERKKEGGKGVAAGQAATAGVAGALEEDGRPGQGEEGCTVRQEGGVLEGMDLDVEEEEGEEEGEATAASVSAALRKVLGVGKGSKRTAQGAVETVGGRAGAGGEREEGELASDDDAMEAGGAADKGGREDGKEGGARQAKRARRGQDGLQGAEGGSGQQGEAGQGGPAGGHGRAHGPGAEDSALLRPPPPQRQQPRAQGWAVGTEGTRHRGDGVCVDQGRGQGGAQGGEAKPGKPQGDSRSKSPSVARHQQENVDDDNGFHSACSKGQQAAETETEAGRADGAGVGRDRGLEGTAAARDAHSGRHAPAEVDMTYNPLALALAAAEAKEAKDAAADKQQDNIERVKPPQQPAPAPQPGSALPQAPSPLPVPTQQQAPSPQPAPAQPLAPSQQQGPSQQAQRGPQGGPAPHATPSTAQTQQQQQQQQQPPNHAPHPQACPEGTGQQQQQKPKAAPATTPASHLVDGARAHHLPHSAMGTLAPLHMGGFTLMKRPGPKGRTQRAEEHAIMVTTSDGRQFMVDAVTGLANVPDKYRKEVSAQLQVIHGLAAAVLNIK